MAGGHDFGPSLSWSVIILLAFIAVHCGVRAYPSEDAKLIATALKNLAVQSRVGAATGQLPVESGNFTDGCEQNQSGRVRFVAKKGIAQLCTGVAWVTFVTTPEVRDQDDVDSSGSSLGRDRQHPAKSCFDLLKKGHSHGDGLYWIKHPGYSAVPYKAFCDMTTEGGGWTLFSTKVSAGFDFVSDTFNASAPHAVNQNAAGCIPRGSPWRQVLFRFRGDGGNSRLVYNRYEGDGQKDLFNKGLTCKTSFPNKSYNFRLGGFVKHTPFVNGGRRIPDNGFHTIPSFYISSRGMSQRHSNSNKWLDLSGYGPNSNREAYDVSNSARAAGTKCIAGVCYLNEPIWMMYR